MNATNACSVGLRDVWAGSLRGEGSRRTALPLGTKGGRDEA